MTLLEELNWADHQAYEDAARGFIATLDDPVIRNEQGKPAWDLDGFPFLAEETAPSHGQPQPVAPVAAAGAVSRPVPGHRGRVPDPRLRPAVMSIVETDNGYVVVDPLLTPSTAKGGNGTGVQAYRQEADRRRHLHPQPHRPLGRRQGRHFRGRGAGGQGQGHRPRTLPGICHQRERHRRQRHEPPRLLHVRQPAAAATPRGRSAPGWARRPPMGCRR